MKIDRAKLRKHATITLTHEEEDLQIKGNALASGDDAEDRRQEEWIRAQLRSGNEWAWCVAIVTVEFAGVIERDTLGACSYESEADFKALGGYYEDMIGEATERLAVRLEEQNDALVTFGLLTGLSCEWGSCDSPISYIDRKGFCYCSTHGIRRRGDTPCRKLRNHEIKRLAAGQTIAY